MAITHAQALDCLASDDLIGIGMEADAVRRSLHPEGVVSYGLDGCLHLQRFKNALATGEIAADSRNVNLRDTDLREIHEDIQQILMDGGTGVSLAGLGSAGSGVAWWATLLISIKQQFPQLRLYGLSATEILAMAASSRLSLRATLLALQEAGLESLTGDDAGILDDSIRAEVFPACCRSGEWIDVHRMAHALGLRSTATMQFGAGETAEQRVRHLETLRALQAETGGFAAFVPRAFESNGSRVGGAALEEATAVEYLKMLAISRMVLDNIENIQTSWATQGLKVLGMGLRFGCNDAGSLREDESRSAAAAFRGATEEELRRVIRDAGFKPVQRDTLYRTMFLN